MRSIFYTAFLYITTILTFVTVAYAFSSGSGTCNADQATIEGVNNSPMGKQGDLGFEITMSQTDHFYVPNGPAIQFTITGSNITTFKGLLFYGADSSNDHVGQWDVPSGYKVMANCPGDPQGTLTHSSASNKQANVTFQWTPPTSDVGPINIFCVICASTKSGFQIIQSTQPFVVNVSTPDNSTISTSTSTPVGDITATAASKDSVTTNSPHPITASNAYSFIIFKSQSLIQLSLFVPMIVSMLIELL
ncbi:4336_t:CDS:2 [Cetraspora pellucida]|uniref:4336_t:CDS:1 n=1 Tax=Cetraspora pellucida TaxID=1433469 RepID=A0ACA9L313_9GLOM|nr:4336_t:CDS:2 [Cetraspora pellucida]